MKYKTVEFSEGMYAALWSAVRKTGDKDSLSLFSEVVHKNDETPIVYYTVAQDLLFGFLEDIQKAGLHPNTIDINAVLHNVNKKGYYKKHYKQFFK